MGVDLVTERWSGRQAEAESDDGLTGRRNNERVFDVTVTDQTADTEKVVVANPGIPALRSQHPDDTTLLCSRRRVRRISPILYEVTAEYEAQTPSADTNPLAQPAKVRFFTVPSRELVDRDINGRVMGPVTGGRFENQEIVANDLAIAVERSVASCDPLLISTYLTPRPSVASDTAFGFPAGTVRVEALTAEYVDSATAGSRWIVSGEFHVRRGAPYTTDQKAWWLRIRHEGFNFFLDDGNGNPLLIGGKPQLIRGLDRLGNKLAEPMLLRNNGTLIPFVDVGGGIFQQDPALANWLEFQVYPSKPFAPLGLW